MAIAELQPKLHLGKYLEDRRGFYMTMEDGRKARPVDLYEGSIVVVSSEFIMRTRSHPVKQSASTRPSK